MPFHHIVFGHFINNNGSLKLIKDLRLKYKETDDNFKLIIAVHCLCSEDPEILRLLVRSYALSILRNQKASALKRPLPSLAEVQSVSFSENEKETLNAIVKSSGTIIGNVASVCAELKNLANSYKADELLLVSHGLDLETRIATFDGIMKHW